MVTSTEASNHLFNDHEERAPAFWFPPTRRFPRQCSWSQFHSQAKIGGVALRITFVQAAALPTLQRAA
jgi:hypothetical protein